MSFHTFPPVLKGRAQAAGGPVSRSYEGWKSTVIERAVVQQKIMEKILNKVKHPEMLTPVATMSGVQC